MDRMNVRWLVLETPVPEEEIVAAMRLRSGSDRIGYIDVLCAAGDVVVREHILRRLLLIAETVSFNLGLKKTIVQVPEWRVDLDGLLRSLGYHQLSGSAWPLDKQFQLNKPTMLLDYHKTLSIDIDSNTAASSTSLSTAAGAEADQIITLGEVQSFNISETSSAAKPNDEMERLMESLFTALHVEYGPSGSVE